MLVAPRGEGTDEARPGASGDLMDGGAHLPPQPRPEARSHGVDPARHRTPRIENGVGAVPAVRVPHLERRAARVPGGGTPWPLSLLAIACGGVGG